MVEGLRVAAAPPADSGARPVPSSQLGTLLDSARWGLLRFSGFSCFLFLFKYTST